MAKVLFSTKNLFDLLSRRNRSDNPVLSPTLLHKVTNIYGPVSFLPDGQHFVGRYSNGTVRKWRVNDGREVGKVMDHGSLAMAVTVSGDGKTIASGGEDGTVVLWSTNTCEKLVESRGKHTNCVMSVSFAPNSQRVASGSRDGSIIVWSATTGEIVTGPFGDNGDWILSLAFSPAGDKISSRRSGDHVQIWDSSSGEEILQIPLILKSVCWSPDGNQLVCGSQEGTIEFFDSSNGARLATWRGYEHAIFSIAFSPDGTWLAFSSGGSTVRLCSTSTRQQLAALDHPGPVFDVFMSPNGRYIASVGHIPEAYIWQLQDVDPTLQEGKEDLAVSPPDAPGSQSAPVNKDDSDQTAPVRDATPAQDPENGHGDLQDSGSDQSHHTTRRASWESWMDKPAVLPARVATDEGIYAHFFDEPTVLQSERSDDCPPREPEKKGKETRRYLLLQQFKNLRDTLLPRDRPSDTVNAPRSSSSQKLKDRIRSIRRRTSLVTENVEHSTEAEPPTGEQETERIRKPKPTRVSYNRLRSTLAVASNDPPVEQKKYYYARRNGRLVPIDPPAPPASQPPRRRRNPFSRTNPRSTPAEGQSPSATPTNGPAQGRAHSPASGDSDVELCACCGFSILARSF